MVARGGCCGWRSLINHLSSAQMSTFYLLLNLPKTGGKRLILYPAGVLFLNLISFSSDTLLNSVYLSDCFKMYFGVVCIQKKLGSNAVCTNGRRQMSPQLCSSSKPPAADFCGVFVAFVQFFVVPADLH